MISTKNPFPGVNPFLERSWPGVHARLIGYIADALAADLPDDLNARPEAAVAITTPDRDRDYRADVAVAETWKRGIAPAWAPRQECASTLALAEPIVLRAAPESQRWVEIREAGGRLVTVIEVLSLTNKNGDGRTDYLRKVRDYRGAGVNVVEIDLLRGGEHALSFSREALAAEARTCPYLVCVWRAASPDLRFVYPAALAQRLPVIAIPLRPADADVAMDLQPLVDRAYENGRHWQDDFARPLSPPLAAADAEWVAERLRAAGLAE